MKYILVGLVFSQMLFSVQLTPMTYEITSMKKRNVTYSVKNTEDNLAAAECKILKVVGHDKNGQEIREETQEVVIYPSQFVLQAKESKGIRVNYTGRSLPKTQQVYRVLATELALNLKEEAPGTKVKAGMKFIFSYEGLLFVGGSDEKTVISSQVHEEKLDSLLLEMKNMSSKSSFVHVKHYEFIAETDKGEVKLTKNDFGKFSGIRLLPNETFTLKLDKNKTLKGHQVKTILIQKRAK